MSESIAEPSIAELRALVREAQDGWARAQDRIEEMERRLSDSVKERDALKRRLAAMFPLFEEARDALTAIPLASAKLRGIDLTLGDRMDEVGDPQRWAAKEAAK